MTESVEQFLPSTRIAYLSMEIAIRPEIPTYAGGLGVLAGDTARSCADLSLPVVFVTLVSRGGYLKQTIGANGEQIDGPDPLRPEDTTPRTASTLSNLLVTPMTCSGCSSRWLGGSI